MQAPLKHLVFTKYNYMASHSTAHHYKNLKSHNWEIGFRVLVHITTRICLTSQIWWPISSALIHVQDLRFSNWSCWVIKSSGTLCCVAGQVVPNVLKDHSAFLFRIKQTASWPFKILSTWGGGTSGTSQQTCIFWKWFILHGSSQHIWAFHLMMLCTYW
jgi:hypothetical protein